MRGLGNTHGVSSNRLKEAFDEDWNTLVKEDTTTMAGDIFTKAFEQKDKWTHACRMINLFDMNDSETAPRIAGGEPKTKSAKKNNVNANAGLNIFTSKSGPTPAAPAGGELILFSS